MLGDCRDELGNPIACRGNGSKHRRTPVSQISQRDIRASEVSFVHDDNMSHFQQPGLHGLYFITEAGRQDRDHSVSESNDVEFILTDSDCLDQNDLVSGRFQYQRCIAGCTPLDPENGPAF